METNNNLDLPPSLPETIRAVQQISSGKAPCSDAIPPEIYKHGGRPSSIFTSERGTGNSVIRAWATDSDCPPCSISPSSLFSALPSSSSSQHATQLLSKEPLTGAAAASAAPAFGKTSRILPSPPGLPRLAASSHLFEIASSNDSNSTRSPHLDAAATAMLDKRRSPNTCSSLSETPLWDSQWGQFPAEPVAVHLRLLSRTNSSLEFISEMTLEPLPHSNLYHLRSSLSAFFLSDHSAIVSIGCTGSELSPSASNFMVETFSSALKQIPHNPRYVVPPSPDNYDSVFCLETSYYRRYHFPPVAYFDDCHRSEPFRLTNILSNGLQEERTRKVDSPLGDMYQSGSKEALWPPQVAGRS
ncbi:unnamed protein product [Schistocephalus solidus]|uniref:Uncharacterized protein n=1 Tax=Schistocephalus solidus TaxID=70667 RepID=A0A3P7EU50_SCHSO|nr:unnamed protein product [Schistocephalus solidus]